ncbi:MAG: transporter substrate-binding domain-containing protein [Chitinivibrionales bacterium]|nr:transporter substrate-binding domain-containing protein [Chitinivibrionales bacterium]
MIKKLLCIVSFLCTLLLCIGNAEEQKPKYPEFHAVADAWPEVTNNDGTGLFFDVIRMVYEPAGITMKYEIMPYARTNEMVKKLEADAWVASFLNEQDYPLYPKWHFDRVPQVAVFKKETEKNWKGETTLTGKKVAWNRGFNLDKFIKVKVNLTEVNGTENGMNMLEKGRVEFYVNAKPDIEKFVESAKFDMSNYQVEHLLFLNLYMAYSNNERGKYFKEVWDKRMEELVKSPKLKELYEKYKYPWPF